MALYIPQSILHLARSLYVKPETYGPTYVARENHVDIISLHLIEVTKFYAWLKLSWDPLKHSTPKKFKYFSVQPYGRRVVNVYQICEQSALHSSELQQAR